MELRSPQPCSCLNQPPTMSYFQSFAAQMPVKILGSHPRVKSHRRPKQLGTLWEFFSRLQEEFFFKKQTCFSLMTSKINSQTAASWLAEWQFWQWYCHSQKCTVSFVLSLQNLGTEAYLARSALFLLYLLLCFTQFSRQ